MSSFRPQSLLIQNGRVVDPSQRVDRLADVVIEDGRVLDIVSPGTAVTGNVDTVVDASGCCVAPGFVDLHTHLRFPGLTAKETVASGTAAAVRGGFTTLCAMANSRPAVDSAEQIEHVRSMVAAEAKCRVEIIGAVTRGLSGQECTDTAELVAEGAIALSDDGNPVVSDECMVQALAASELLAVPISVHEEMHPTTHGSRWPCRDEVEMVRRDLEMLRRFGGRLHIAHISCRESVELLAEAQAHGVAATAEATPHHLTLTNDLWCGDMFLPSNHPSTKVNPPLRDQAAVTALRAGLSSGVITSVATDHAPHCGSDKAGDYDDAAFGMIGLELALPVILDMVNEGSMTMLDAVDRLTSGPSKAFNLKAGTLVRGSAADICIFDPMERWQASRDSIVSKGKNSPMLHRTLTGRVTATIVGGKVSHFGRDHELRAFRA